MAIGYFFVRSLPSTRTRDFIEAWLREYQPGTGQEYKIETRSVASTQVNNFSGNSGSPTGTATNGAGTGSDNAGSAGSTSGTGTTGNAGGTAAPASPAKESAAAKIVESALAQAKTGAKYAPGYFELKYPGGDLPPDKGVCTDVLVRALRNAGFDLQQLINEDMTKNFDKYPNIWGLRKPDPNIDHRRNPNLMSFFKRFGKSLTCEATEKTLQEWQPGDVVFWRLANSRLHCGILIDKKNDKGIPLVVQNLSVCNIEDCLTKWKIIGHFRYP